jgi:predicted hydrocarbon binding protein
MLSFQESPSMVIPDMELAETIRFALTATKELHSSDFHSQKDAVARLGVELGHEVAKSLASGTKEDVYGKLARFWIDGGLGKMVLIQSNPVVIRLSGCLNCNSSKTRGAPVFCTFKKSLLETIFQDSLGESVSLHELECCRSGGYECVFRLKIG